TEFRVLRLQEIVVSELRNTVTVDACGGPVELHPQALCKSAVVQVLAVPRLPCRDELHGGGAKEEQQEGEHEVLQGRHIGIEQEHQSHEECQHMCDAKGRQRALLVMNRKPVGNGKKAVDLLEAGGEMAARFIVQ